MLVTTTVEIIDGLYSFNLQEIDHVESNAAPPSPIIGLASSFFMASEPETKDVDVPGVGRMRVRVLTVGEWRAYQKASIKTANGKATFEPDLATLVRLGTIDSDGRHIFSDTDLPRLRSNVSVSRVMPLAKAIFALCGDSDIETTAEGNSEETTGNAS